MHGHWAYHITHAAYSIESEEGGGHCKSQKQI